jgi:hypothetical protein
MYALLGCLARFFTSLASHIHVFLVKYSMNLEHMYGGLSGMLKSLASHIVKVTHKNQVNLRRDEELTGKRTNERNGCMKGGADALDADGLEIEGEAAGVYAPCKEA